MNRLAKLAIALALAAASHASTVIAPSGGFITGNDRRWGQLNNSPDPFWDHEGSDQASCNIGYYISGAASSCPGSAQPGGVDRIGANNAGPRAELDYIGVNRGRNVAAMNFAPGSTATFAVTIMAELAGNHGYNELGVYITNAGSSWGVAQTLILLSGPYGPGVTKYFSPGGRNFGFYIRDRQGNTWYSGQSTAQTWQPFTVFRGNEGGYTGSATTNWSTLWIGAEDGANGDSDFNDMIFKVTTTLYPGGPAGSLVEVTPTPEPGPLLLIGSGLFAFSLCGRRARR